ncbi:M56 family metallopeptidase [Bacteroides sp.]
MAAYLFYILKSAFCLGVFYVVFRALLSRSTFFRFNRITLLTGMCCCMLLPLLEFTTDKENLLNVPFQTVKRALIEVSSSDVLPEESTDMIEQGIPFAAGRTIENPVPGFTVSHAIMGFGLVYLLGACGVLVLLIVSTIRMLHLIHSAEKRKCEAYILVLTKEPVGSFSWGHYIVISEGDYESQPDDILLHEQMHLRNRHTLDLLLLQCFLILQWFNPAVWLLRRELQEIHEYEADNGVINTGIDATRYQLLLVKKAVGTRLYSMANGFNHSKLKNRITMMLKERTNGWARLKLLLFVPVVVGALYAFAQPEVKETLVQVVPEVQQEEMEDYVSLMKFFRREEEACSFLINGSRPPARVNEKQAHKLLVNTKNQILFDGIYCKQIAGLKSIVMENLLKSWENSNRKDPQIIFLTYDRGADITAITAILKEVKSAFEQIRADLSATSTDKSKEYLDRLFPILLKEGDPKEFGLKALPKDEQIEGIVVTLQTAEGEEVIENFTLGELERKVVAARDKMADPELFTVSIKVDKNSKMGPVTDVKNVLRKAYATKKVTN